MSSLFIILDKLANLKDRMESRMSEPTVSDAEHVIRKIEACKGIGAKIVLLRNFTERCAGMARLEEAKLWWHNFVEVSPDMPAPQSLSRAAERIAFLEMAALKFTGKQKEILVEHTT